jgi:hypothetical protein
MAKERRRKKVKGFTVAVRMGRNLKKMRFSLNGMKRPMPLPASVEHPKGCELKQPQK